MQKIGFIGVGVMGSSIVKHLLQAGYEVSVYTRTKNKAQDVLQLGAKWENSPALLTATSDIVMTMVGYPSDVEDVYFGEYGIFSASIQGKIMIDLTTSTPSLAKRIAKHALEHKSYACDAPVSGGDIGAKNGTLTTMVGCHKEIFDAISPLLSIFSSKVKWQGGAGAGQHTKMANQIMIAGTMTGMTELLVYAKAAGLDVASVIETVSAGSGANWSLSNYAPRVLVDDYSPGFYAKHFLKDLRIALDEAEKMGLNLPGTQTAAALYKELVEAGFGDCGTQSLIKII
ncbi:MULTISPECIES: NAD(P)-dependent oxidoreductase [unclassified Granulicatella]|uniref:NAD(P)-dependent oxidoreductase n=1 Tax=unclassified Granulicatella TaxID=2630493 RepID=UPI001073B1F7|nr:MULTISPECIES: NAD(P)-dependent oxidoreductase [unclassified Granulicatella]MBF0779930.1 NAD(P)-dependent oxidoreductase [Granulicatella sp. 19428wC4_WM01]TFU96041.1 NAD(P)-dependent oxidoreductase [Granulicatella sp. WM01]